MTTITGTNGADFLEDRAGDVAINALAGDDVVFLNNAGVKTVSLGSGQDYVNTSMQRVNSIVFTDFETGAAGDVFINFATWYWRAGVWWTPLETVGASGLSSPFAAGVARVQDGPGGATLQVRTTVAADWSTIATFQGVAAAQLTQRNLGWAPDGSAAVGQQLNQIESMRMFINVDTYGDDVIHGTDASGFLHYTQGADVIYAGGGSDTIYGVGGITSGLKTIYAGDGDDQVAINGLYYGVGEFGQPLGSTTRGLVYGGNGNDQIGGEYNNDEFYGEAGNDRVFGGFGDDIVDGGSGDDWADGGHGNDIVRGGDGTDRVTGDRGDDRMDGGAGNDDLNGGAGNDILDGGTGVDQLTGGQGNDIYFVDSVADVVTEIVGEGVDSLYSTTNVALAESSEVELIVFGGSTATGSLTGNHIVGNAQDNVITALAGNDYLQGGAGDDTLLGGAGIDYLDGEGGADVMRGGADDDVYVLDHAADQVIEAAGEGYDRIYTGVSLAFAAGSEIEFAVLTGSAAGMTGSDGVNHLVGNGLDNVLIGLAGGDYLQGEAGADRLFGDDGNDFFDGGAGADIMLGGTGDDIFLVDNAGDDVRETAGQGYDRVYSGTDVYLGLPSEIEFVRLTGAAATAGGSDTANQIVGTAGANLINGYAGDDYLQAEEGDDFLLGAAGADYLDGGMGADRMDGGTGDDTFIADHAGDRVVEAAGGGSDRVFASANLSLDADSEVEIVILTGAAATATGSDTANRIIGNGLDNLLSGRGGADVLEGGAGLDSASYAGASTDYKVTRSGADFLVRDMNAANGDEGEDRLSGVERLTFANGSFTIDSLVSDRIGASFAQTELVVAATELSFPTGDWSYMIA